ncbi:inorganic phosphate transporter [Geitlerinema sp. PCC 7407]|uniref:inorganic phosphate transporter n=1 Tax=Geitlerinema sp. PCC 7407 TaxID=1173025 RepID=UPI00029FB362|nr:inorganic phosphate transporter [Geitlerinema sp. PCC 7407]AFY65575.1 phosphate transporter [Geitlerinema sp. PCC 7407]
MTPELLIGLTSVLAFYLAWNLGANDVANSMGTSVGSKAITLKQAIVIAGILELGGALLLGQRVSGTLATQVVQPESLAASPQLFVVGMIMVLVTCGLWLQIATSRGWPVSSSHATLGAIAGFGWMAAGAAAVNWQTLGSVALAWVLTPLMSGAIAAGLYGALRHWILEHPEPQAQLDEWIPWLSVGLLGVFGVLIVPTLSEAAWLEALPLPAHDPPLLLGGLAAVGITWSSWRRLSRSAGDRAALETVLGRFQVISACFVAFAHGSNDVGNAIAPLAAIAYTQRTGSVPLANFSIPFWILLIGGVGIVFGLAIFGKNVITTVGEGIIALQPSSGFCAELSAATTVLLASHLGLPVSTSHTLIGAVVGIGLLQGAGSIRFQTVRGILLAWVVTVPAAVGLSAGLFAIARWLWAG